MRPNASKTVRPVAPAPTGNAAPLPLVVKLDGGLLLTDTLFESVAEHMRRRPLWTMAQLVQLPFSIAKVKVRLQRGAVLDIDTLPVNQEVLSYCLRAKASGRPVWLVSAADQEIVNAVAARFALFDRAIGSDGENDNKGASKAAVLEQEARDGFEYIGDSHADVKVWAKAIAASHVGGGAARRQAIKALGVKLERSFERPHAGLSAWRKAMRLHQWTKNALIFAPALLAMKWGDPAVLLACVLAFPLLGLMASGTYIANDLLDLKADRNHPSKRLRPLASGQIKLWQGFLAAPVLILTGLLGAAMISAAFAATMASYLIVTFTYSLKLKRIALADTMALAFLYTLRLVMGGVLADVGLSQWLLVFSMFLFVSLSLAKRHVEVARRAAEGERRLTHRGYRAEDAALTLGLGLATATASPLILVLYIIESAWPSGVYSLPDALWVAPVILSMWLMRLWLLANRGELDDDPVVFAIRDRQSVVMGMCLALGFATAAFAPPGSLALLRLH
jgi:4-hydroxybenzoate polyprenyltransferase